MARMLGKIGLSPIVYGIGTGRMKKCLGCPAEDCGYQKPKKTQRQREKRVAQRWLDEYETIHDYDSCPTDGLACTCNKPEYECPHRE